MSVKWLNKQTNNQSHKKSWKQNGQVQGLQKSKNNNTNLERPSESLEYYCWGLLENTRKFNPLDEKYKEIIGRLQPLHSTVMLIKGEY